MTVHTAPSACLRPPSGFPSTARLVDGGDMECASGLLLITRAMRRLEDGDLLAIRSSAPSVRVDLPAWAEMVDNDIAARAGSRPRVRGGSRSARARLE